MLKSTCKQFLFLYCVFAQVEFCFVLHIFWFSAKGLFVKKMHVLNKDIVHMIDHIFWKCNFRTELQGEQVFFFIIEIIVLFKIIAIIVLIEVVLKGTR